MIGLTFIAPPAQKQNKYFFGYTDAKVIDHLHLRYGRTPSPYLLI